MPEVELGRQRVKGLVPKSRGGGTGGMGGREVRGVAFRTTLDRLGALLVYLTERPAGI